MKSGSFLGKLSGIVFLCALTLFCLAACDNKTPAPSQTNTHAENSKAAAKIKTIQAELAPFDRFPLNIRAPLVFRFSHAIAPPNRSNPQNFTTLSVNPARPGSWQWNSDSEL